MRVFAIRRDDKVTVILGTKHCVRTGREADQLYEAAQTYRATRSDEALDALLDIVNPYQKYIRTGVLREDNGALYLGESNIPLPATLAKTIMEYLDRGYPIDPLVNFWHWCLLNPNTTARDRFFEYCQNYGITITDSGMAVLYKAVTQKEDNRAFDLAHFVATEWLQVKRQGENPEHYYVFENPNGFRSIRPIMSDTNPAPCTKSLGSLQDLFNRIHEQSLEGRTVYTDKHSRSMDIKLGVPVFKPREQCDPNIHNECSYGLHVGSFKYVRHFGSGNDTVFACLVNPMNVVALPNYDNSKIRVCEYYPYAVMNTGNANDWEELPSAFFEGEYTPYSLRALKDLEMNLLDRLANVDMSTEAFKLIEEQAHIVKTKLNSIYKENPDADDVELEEPIEAPFEETYFDVDDPWATNQKSPADSYRENYCGDRDLFFMERARNAWKQTIEKDGFEGSFDEFLEDYHENEDDSCCPDCGCEECDCEEENDGREVITRDEAKARWRAAVVDGSYEESFELFVEDKLVCDDVFVEDWTW